MKISTIKRASKNKIGFTDLKLFVFPLFLIAIYEIYSIHVYRNTNSSPALYPSWGFYYFSIMSTIVAFIASIISDKVGRKKLLIFCLIIAFVIFSLIHLNYELLALLISPLFFSTPIARAALIDNHEHLSVKNLMCFSYMAVFIPWSFLPQISIGKEYPYINVTLIICLFSAFFFTSRLNKKIETDDRKIISLKPKILSLLLAFLAAQIIFFLIIDKIINIDLDNKLKLFTFLGLGSFVGVILCFISKARHEDLITLSFTFLLLLTFGSLLIFYYWGEIRWESSLGLIGILGGFYLPVVTERSATILGKQSRGFACGLVELVITCASLLTLILPKKILEDLFIIITLIFLALLAYIFQRYHDKLIRG